VQRLYQAGDRIEAQLLRDFLDRHLVRTAILGDYLAGAAGELPVDIFPTLWVVDDADLPRARVLVERFLVQSAAAESGPPWVCPACGETLEAGFDLCWNCGHERE
jgi:hypothetical protein